MPAVIARVAAALRTNVPAQGSNQRWSIPIRRRMLARMFKTIDGPRSIRVAPGRVPRPAEPDRTRPSTPRRRGGVSCRPAICAPGAARSAAMTTPSACCQFGPKAILPPIMRFRWTYALALAACAVGPSLALAQTGGSNAECRSNPHLAPRSRAVRRAELRGRGHHPAARHRVLRQLPLGSGRGVPPQGLRGRGEQRARALSPRLRDLPGAEPGLRDPGRHAAEDPQLLRGRQGRAALAP
jgi:hypothetical protein